MRLPRKYPILLNIVDSWTNSVMNDQERHKQDSLIPLLYILYIFNRLYT